LNEITCDIFVCVVGVWQRTAAKHRLRTRRISQVISVKHVQHSLMIDRTRSETCRSDFNYLLKLIQRRF